MELQLQIFDIPLGLLLSVAESTVHTKQFFSFLAEVQTLFFRMGRALVAFQQVRSLASQLTSRLRNTELVQIIIEPRRGCLLA